MFKPQEMQTKINFKNQSNAIEETDFPLHTLSQDLVKLKQDPAYDPSDFSKEQEELINEQTRNQMTDKQKTSPFLNQAEESVSQAKTEMVNDSRPAEKTVAPEIEAISSNSVPLIQKTSFKITLIVLLAILLIFALAFTVYYYKTKSNNNPAINPNESVVDQQEAENGFSFPVEESSSDDDSTTVIQEENVNSAQDQNNTDKAVTEKEPIFSLDKPNFLILEDTSDQEASLKKYIQEMASMEKGSLVEFVPVDSSYNPLPFKNFYSVLGITFPDNIIGMFDNEKQYSLLLYNDTDTVKLNLAIPIKNAPAALAEMKKWEPTMLQDLNKLILPGDNLVSIDDFGESTYADTLIRYKNVSSDGSIAIDYFIKNNLLSLTTSKNATLRIIDSPVIAK